MASFEVLDTSSVISSFLEKYLCPNDRQLALRAKLGTGWSVHTNNAKKTEPLSVNCQEIENIKAVLKRAEKVRHVEQKRIGKLIEKIEEIKILSTGNGSTDCTICAEPFAISSSGSPLFCSQCHKTVCCKCVMEIHLKRFSYYLCKICSYHRELWKKSGAWFYNDLPSFILPEDGVARLKSKRKLIRRYSRKELSPPISSENDSSEDELAVMRKQHREHLISKGLISSRQARSSDAEHSNKESPEASHHSSPDKNMRSFFNFHDDSEGLSSNVESSHEGSLTKLCSSPLPNRSHSPSLSSEASNSKLSHLQTSTPSPDKEERMSLSPPAQSISKKNRGNLRFSLMYDQVSCHLQCIILKATNLPPMDVNGLADPYVKSHLVPGSTKATKQRSSTKQKTLNPIFNEALNYFGVTTEDYYSKTVRLSIFDEDCFGQNEFIGEVRVRLNNLRHKEVQTFDLPLQKQLDFDLEDDLAQDNVGKILVGILYMFKQQCLVVTIKRCSELASKDNNGYSDPFVKVYLQPDSCKETKRKTNVIKKTLNPDFNEEFIYNNIKIHELAKKTLDITVWDADFAMKNDYIGGLALSMAAKGEKLKHWIKIFKQPDVYFEQWHKLSPEPPASTPVDLDKLLPKVSPSLQ